MTRLRSALIAFAAVAASLAVTPVAPAAADSVPAGTSPSSTLAVLGTDQSLWVRQPNGAWSAQGGSLIGQPVAVDVPGGSTVLLGVGRDHHLWAKLMNGAWQLASGAAWCADSPAAVLTQAGSPNTLTVACEGSDRALWYSQTALGPGSVPSFTTWVSGGGVTTFGPAVVLLGGHLQFLVTGTDQHVWLLTPGAAWIRSGWLCNGRPLGATAPGGTSYFACEGTDGSLWYAIGQSDWGSAANAGGRMIQPLTASADAGQGHLVVQGADWAAWQFDTGTRAWTSLGGRVWPGCRLDPVGFGCGRIIVISLSRQWLFAYQDGVEFLDTPVTTGRPALPTPPGDYSVLRKVSPWLMTSDFPPSSPYWYPPSWVTYTLWFRNDGYAIHDAPWRSAYGPGTQAGGSHGCVNVPMPTMRTLYNWASVGTPVVVQQ